ncbi:umecyanin-like [Cucurbita pepo subsp. pepo]|uniref:umecyanin-like n=1 Tax=Cucurbita pepo subsp. pepo TaxID=3664 RepID=UPI000C9D31B1|nr:umecyanin-like [Cucurbita pepo subsp. pepo]
MDKMYVALMIGIFSCLLFMPSMDAFTHIVGGNHGWRVPDNVTFFDEWAKPRTFGVGDKLVFPYRPGANNLLAVKKADYETCGQGEEDVINMYYLGPTILNITQPGDYYYYDGIGKHCEAGQKLHIQVGSKEGTSGSDPLPFNLQTFGIPTAFGTMVEPPAAAPVVTLAAPRVVTPAAAMAHKFGLASSAMLMPVLLSIFL